MVGYGLGSIMSLKTVEGIELMPFGDGVEMIVPNSTFLSSTVVNWTLSDPNHCYENALGVAAVTDTSAIRRKALIADIQSKACIWAVT